MSRLKRKHSKLHQADNKQANEADHDTSERNEKRQKRAAAIRSHLAASEDDDSDEEDNVPLMQRRAFSQTSVQVVIEMPMSDCLSPEPFEPIEQEPAYTASSDMAVDEFNVVSEMDIATPGETALEKLCNFMDRLCASLDSATSDDLIQKSALQDGHASPTIRLKALRKFRVLMLRAIQDRCMDSVDKEKLGRIMRNMGSMIEHVSELDIIACYAKAVDDQKLQTTQSLQSICHAIEIGALVLEILTASEFDKRIFPEGLILSCLQLVKNQLDNIIYPLFSLTIYDDDTTHFQTNARSFLQFAESMRQSRVDLATLLPLITRFLRYTFKLLQQDEIDDHMIVVIAYISMGPFFHEYDDQKPSCLIPFVEDMSVHPFEQLKYNSMDMLCKLFSNYPRHRLWMLEEILTSLNSMTSMDHTVKRYRLRNNTTIHIMSALFMQLIQSCCTVTDLTGNRNWLRQWELKAQKMEKANNDQQLSNLRSTLMKKASITWKSGIEAASQSAVYFVEMLLSKCKSRKKESYSVVEYRIIVEDILNDVMTVLNNPEWPVAELIIRVFSKILIAQLESERSDAYLKSLSIDWLGTIARHIQSSNNRLAGEDNSFTPEWIYTLYEELPDKINSDTPAWAIELLGSCRSKLLEGLARNQLNSSVSQFYLCTWGYANMLNWQWDAKKDSDAVEISNWSPESVLAVQTSVERYWFMSLHLSPESEPEYSDFQFPEMNYADIELLAELLMSKQALYQSFNFLLSQIVACLDKEIVTFRVKALRALSRLAAESPRLLNETRLQTAVIHRIRDSSPSVRDAAIEVIAKYLGGQDNISLKLYKIVSARIMDTAVNVRKRMVKLLRDLYFTCDDGFIKIDIAAKIILRIGDNEVTISDLAIKMAQEILFHPFRDIDMEEANSFGYAYGDSNKQRKTRIARLTDIIVNAMANMEMITATKRDTALVQIVQKTMKTTDEKQRIWYEKVFQWIVDALFDRLLPLDEVGERKRFLHCLETAYAFIKSCPNLLRQTQISLLQPYLSVAEKDDWPIARYVLTIYREVLPRMRFLDPDFVKHIERTLLQMLTNGPLEMMDSVVGCICSFVNISGRYILLVKVLGSCIEKLTKEQACVEQSGTCLSNEKQIMKMMLICGLLCRYFDFDGKRKTEASQMDLLGDTDKDITTTIFELLLFFAHLSENNMAQALQIRVVALQSLGHVYARNPTLMIDKRSTDLLDSTIVDSSMIMRIQLMKVFHDFLGTEEQRIEKQEEAAGTSLYTKLIDVETLLGNTSEFAELGVNGSIMQRYLGKILECSIDTHTELRDAAFEVITVVMQQGLAHPAFCMPAIVAAETSPDLMLRNNAYYLHKMAHTKYGSILYIRLADFVTTAYRYQCMISSEAVKGYGRMGGDAMLESLFTLAYGIMAQKRTVKLDFLLVLIKPFDCDLKDPETAKLEVAFLQFLADNLLTLQFTHSEEPLHIIHYINRIMTTLGSDLLSQVQNLREEGVLDDDFYGISGTGTMDLDYLITAISCTGLCILYHVRRMLKTIYHLSDKETEGYDPNERQKGRSIVRNVEMNGVIDWYKVLPFTVNGMDHVAASRACTEFEKLILDGSMSDDGDDDDDERDEEETRGDEE